MIAYVTSIGERTEEICCLQLQRFGFKVLVVRGSEDWFEKYKRFIIGALQDVGEEGCIRIDADVIVNRNIGRINLSHKPLMAQWKGYDFYRNDIGIISPVYYSRKALEIISKNLNKLDPNRPEATAWRLKEINPRTVTFNEVIGMHGFFQNMEHYDRHLEHKMARKQMGEYDFELAKLILEKL